MISMHPKFLPQDGIPQFAVLPYEEYLQVAEALARAGETAPADPRYGGFWDNLSVDELARRQGVKPIADLSSLAWPFGPEDWEGFEDAVDEWRHGDANG